jgi:hypothetical protein
MSEIPAPYNPKGRKLSPLEHLAAFMTGYLTVEVMVDLPTPENLQCDYDDLDDDGKREWYEYTLNELFRMAARDSFSVLGRGPNLVELGLIKRRIVNFFKQAGIEYEKE